MNAEIGVRIGDRQAVVGLGGKAHSAVFSVPRGFDFEVASLPDGVAVSVEESFRHEIDLTVTGPGVLTVYVDDAVRDAGVGSIVVSGLF